MDASKGEVATEVLSPKGRVREGLPRPDGVLVRADQAGQAIRNNKAVLSAVPGKPVRSRFYLRGGRLYAFWVSAQASGASGG